MKVIAEGFHFMIDAETQLPGEGEIVTAMRLLRLVIDLILVGTN
jgi:hypothetical protein